MKKQDVANIQSKLDVLEQHIDTFNLEPVDGKGEILKFKCIVTPTLFQIVKVTDNIVEALKDVDFNYSMYEAIYALYTINEFTDIPLEGITAIADERDLSLLEIVYALDRKYEIVTAMIENEWLNDYMSQIETAVWRKVDMDKTLMANYGANSFFAVLTRFLENIEENMAYNTPEKLEEVLKAVDKISNMNKQFNNDFANPKHKSGKVQNFPKTKNKQPKKKS